MLIILGSFAKENQRKRSIILEFDFRSAAQNQGPTIINNWIPALLVFPTESVWQIDQMRRQVSVSHVLKVMISINTLIKVN